MYKLTLRYAVQVPAADDYTANGDESPPLLTPDLLSWNTWDKRIVPCPVVVYPYSCMSNIPDVLLPEIRSSSVANNLVSRSFCSSLLPIEVYYDWHGVLHVLPIMTKKSEKRRKSLVWGEGKGPKRPAGYPHLPSNTLGFPLRPQVALPAEPSNRSLQ